MRGGGWRAEWAGISAEIAGLIEAAQVFFASQVRNEGDTTAVTSVLVPHAGRVFEHLEAFHQRFRPALPKDAGGTLERFVSSNRPLFTSTEMKGRIQMRLTLFAILRVELDYLFSDTNVYLRRVTERASLHLRRSIVVDERLRAQWQEAFGVGEVRCEQLGAVHLLQHGIWAFKADAKGERTDLVFREPLVELAQVECSAEGLILTEWKVVRRPAELESRIEAACRQAERYSTGSPTGIELTTDRYLVMVSGANLQLSADLIRGAVTSPRVPSVS